MIPGLHAGHARTDFADNPGAFMAEDGGEKPLRIKPIQRVGIRVANASCHDFDQDFAGFGAIQINGFDGERLFRLPSHGGARFHRAVSLNAFGGVSCTAWRCCGSLRQEPHAVLRAHPHHAAKPWQQPT